MLRNIKAFDFSGKIIVSFAHSSTLKVKDLKVKDLNVFCRLRQHRALFNRSQKL